MSKQTKGGGRGPATDDDKRPERQTDESAGTIKQPQKAAGRDEPHGLSRGSEAATADASRRR